MIADNIVNDPTTIFRHHFQCLRGLFFIIFKDTKAHNGIGMIGVSLSYRYAF